jgi:tetratricopeptide (TPR) repeat protein
MADEETLRTALDHLKKDRFNEGLALLEGEESADAVQLRYRIQRARKERVDAVLAQAEEALKGENWEQAESLVAEARALDREGEHEGVRQTADRLAHLRRRHEVTSEVAKKKQRALNLLEADTKGSEDLDTAIRLLEEAVSLDREDFEARSLLNKAQAQRSEYLASVGQVATLEQAGEFEAALKEVKNLIARGHTEFQGEDIHNYRARLEARCREFAEAKAGKYLGKAEAELESDPALALTYIETALGFPFVPDRRLQDLKDLKIKAEHLKERHARADKVVQEALVLMNRDREYEQAISHLESALAEVPSHAEAERHLKRARAALEARSLQQARAALTRARSRLEQQASTQARAELEACAEALASLHDHPEAESLEAERQDLLAEADRQEDHARRVDQAIREIGELIQAGELAAAQVLLDELDPEVLKHPRLRSPRTEVARRQKLEEALDGVKLAMDEGDYAAAHEQVQVVRRRAKKNPEVDELYKEVEATFHYHNATEAVGTGALKEARKALQKVLGYGSLYLEEAAQLLEEVNEQVEQEKAERKLYRDALRLKEAERFEEAHAILSEADDLHGEVRKEIARLSVEVRSAWRKQLTAEIRESLKGKSHDEALDLAEKLAALGMSVDTELISRVRKEFHLAKAQAAASQEDWDGALEHWQEMQRYDAANPRVAAGLKEARRGQAVREADATPDVRKKVALLEAVVDLKRPDPEVEERLARALLAAEEVDRASHLAVSRINVKSTEIAAWARTLRDLCVEFQKAKKKLEIGAYRESIALLEGCIADYPGYEHVTREVLDHRQSEVVSNLLKQARGLETAGEGPAQVLPVYAELLGIVPDHMEARQRNEELLKRLSLRISDLLHEAVQLGEEETVSEREVEDKIREMQETLTVATTEQRQKLEAQLDALSKKNRALKAFHRKLGQIRGGLLGEALETGDFSLVDRELAEATRYVSSRHHDLIRLSTEVRELKEGRERAEGLAQRVQRAFEELDFASLESHSRELERADADDQFHQQRKLRLIDPVSKEKLPFKELVGWAQQRRQNLERIKGWLRSRRPDLTKLEVEEAELRQRTADAADSGERSAGLERLAREYRRGGEGLTGSPEAPLSPRAAELVEEAEGISKGLAERAAELEDEVLRLREDEERVRRLIEEVGAQIQAREFSAARALIDEGLALAPGNRMLRHFREVVEDE